MNKEDLEQAKWRKSSRSNGQANCVEVADLSDGGRAVRDSKDRGGPTLRFAHGAWSSFVTAIRLDEFHRA